MITFYVALDQAFFAPGASRPGNLVLVYGAQTNADEVFPTVWAVQSTVLASNPLEFPWQTTANAFVLDTPVGDGLVMPSPSAYSMIGPGQTLSIASNLEPTVNSVGPQSEMSFSNGSNTPLAVGLGLGLAGATPAPLFVASLPGNGLMQAIPGPYAVLFFSHQLPNVGEMIGRSPYNPATRTYLPNSQLLQINLQALSELSVPATVTFTPNEGWKFSGSSPPSWASTFPATYGVSELAMQQLSA